MVVKIFKIGHLSLETPDLQKELEHYTDVIGLTVTEQDARRAILLTSLGEEALILEKGLSPRVSQISFQVDPDRSLREIAAYLGTHGIAAERKSNVTPAISETVEFQDPAGTSVQLFTEVKMTERPKEPNGIAPTKLGHVAFMVPSAKRMVEFYTQLFGFKESDWIEDFFAFLRCGPDHHTLNFMSGDQGRMHHLAFELRDWAHVESACDFLARKEKKIIWGPGRHGVGHNIFVYHRDADDHIVELYAELDQMKNEELGYFDPRPWHTDLPQRPKVWDRPSGSLTWGTPPTAEYLRTHAKKTWSES